jgi:selenocysteine-specific elongation factor
LLSTENLVSEIIIGTAGHIDHGKTALVKALTGIDADRLPEEKRRGITVDLGFAELRIGDIHFGFVDVPGHERFVKNMLAGASGIDLVLLVIAADEGVMPQTREHFDICRLLGVNAGIVVLTKSDLVDAETLELAKLDAAELVAGSFLERALIVSVSARTGQGIADLTDALNQIAAELPERDDQLVMRLPIDRSFSMKGFGAVVTGTLASGIIVEGAEAELLPDKIKARIRGLQTHGQGAKTANAGQRVAVNLGGIDHSKVTRGMVLSEPNVIEPTQIVDAEIEVLLNAARPLRSRQRVRAHIGTIEALARVQVLNENGEIAAGARDMIQIRLETPVVAVPGEKFIIRSYSPQITIAGGTVIDPLATRHRRRELNAVRQHLSDLLNAADAEAKINLLVNHSGPSGVNFTELQGRTAYKSKILKAAVDANVASGRMVRSEERYISSHEFKKLQQSAERSVKEFHKREPLAKGMPREAVREKLFAFLPPEIFRSVIASMECSGTLILDKETIRLSTHQQDLSPAEAAFNEKVLATYKTAGLEVPKLDDVLSRSSGVTPQNARKLFKLILDSGAIVKVSEEFYFATDVIKQLIALLQKHAAETDDRLMDVPKFKQLAGISRKYAIPLLEYFDREHVTSRIGDRRYVQK